MGVLKVVLKLGASTGIPRDATQNTWVFSTPAQGTTTIDLDNIAGQLQQFYQAPLPGGEVVAAYFGDQVFRSATAGKIEFFDITNHLDGSPAGSPLEVRDFSFLTPSKDVVNLPSEIAGVLSFHSIYAGDPEFGPVDPVTGKKSRPRARDRGRLYLGPLNAAAMQRDGTTHEPYLSGIFGGTVVEAADRLVASTVGTIWCQWSRVAKQVAPVAGGWVDDAFDVQRRRGVAPRTRAQFGGG